MRRIGSIVGLLVLTGAFTLQAATLYVDPGATGANDGTTWVDAYTNLTTALSNDAHGDDLWLAAGTYRDDSTFALDTANISLYGGFTSGMAWGDRDPAAHIVILDGQSARRVMTITAAGVTLDGLTVKDGTIGGANDGGGVHGSSTGLTITNCIFTANFSGRYGGGLYVAAGAEALTVVDSIFTNNQSAHSGGAIYGAAVPFQLVNCRLANNATKYRGGAIYNTGVDGQANRYQACVFVGNQATNASYEGGAIDVEDGSLELIDCGFTNNSGAAYGGAVFADTATDSAFLSNCTFTANSSQSQGGAARILTLCTMIDCVFQDNRTVSYGGALAMDPGVARAGGTNRYANCLFLQNKTTISSAGALYAVRGYQEFTDCEFIENTARLDGGAIYGHSTAERLTLINCDFIGNQATNATASDGGAIWNQNAIIADNCTFISNTAAGGTAGAIYGDSDHEEINEFTDCLFLKNESQKSSGGGIILMDGYVEMSHTDFIKNWANDHGGGFYLSSGGEGLIADNCRFVSNTALRLDGGAILCDNGMTLTDCVFLGNSAKNFGGAIRSDTDNGDAETISLIDCQFVDNHSTNNYAGAVYAIDGHLVIQGCGFTNNSARVYGGAIYAAGAQDMTIQNCEFENNAAGVVSGHGGAIYNNSLLQTIRNTVFKDNSAFHSGGAIYASAGDHIITDCEFSGNEANTTVAGHGGGAMYIAGNYYNSSFSNCTFTANTAPNQQGGALYILNSYRNIDLVDVTFHDNEAGTLGGAIYNANAGGTNRYLRTDFVNSTAGERGGAVYQTGWNHLDEYRHCAFITNSVSGLSNLEGGALFLNNARTARVANCTFFGNLAEKDGGAIELWDGTLYVTNSIFHANNAQEESDDIYVRTGSELNIGYSMVDTNEAIGTGVENYGAGLISLDPLFTDAAGHDVHLQSVYGRWDGEAWVYIDTQTSPAIDAGDGSDFSQEPQPNGGIVNLGRYGNTPEASRSGFSDLIVATRGATVTAGSATLSGYLVHTNANPVTVMLYWGDEDGGTNAASWDAVVTNGTDVAVGPVSNTVAIAADKTCYYRFYAANPTDTAWAGKTEDFVTGELSISATDPDAAEAGTDPGTFTISRPTGTIDEELAVSYTVSGTAQGGLDYHALSGTLTIPAGEQTATVTVAPIDDMLIEGAAETVDVTLLPGTYVLGASIDATVTIADNDSNLTQWDYKMRISLSGYDRAEVLTNFPALILLNEKLAGFDYSQFTSADGYDLQIVSADGSRLFNYEIDSWNASGDSLLWVQVPELTSNTTFWVYWGNSAVTEPVDYTVNGATWSAGYQAVWHLQGTNAIGLIPDSGPGAHDGTIDDDPTPLAGVVGGSYDFDGTDDSMEMGSGFDLRDMTLSCWVYLNTDVVNYPMFLTMSGSDMELRSYATTEQVEIVGGPTLRADAVDALSTGVWTHVTVTADELANTTRIYLDGTEVKSGVWSKPGGKDRVVTLAERANDAYELNGRLDEVRMADVARSANWVWAAWMNMASNSTFYVSEQVLPISGGPTVDLW